ncbi:MAG: hypothetical protein P4L84_28445 [Isosphaeraceae bacterium]|nr:hypothetical protein [Isosphaeraceae bacterium]
MNKTSRSPLLYVALLIALVALEAQWLRWVLSEPLPNAGNVGGMVRRSLFLWRAFPGVVPGVRFDQSYLGQAANELSHLQNLPQRIPIVLGASLIGGAALALGGFVLRALGLRRELTTWQSWPLAFGVGMSGLGVVTLLAGRLGLLAPLPVRVGLATLAIAGIAASRKPFARSVGLDELGDVPPAPSKTGGLPALPWVAFVVITAPFLVVMALGAMLPTIDFDAIEYHLQGPREYFEQGRIRFLPHNVYTSMPFGVEMLHLLGMHVMGETYRGALVGQLLVAAHAPAAAACLMLAARRWGSPRASWFAGVVYLTTPWIYRVAAIPYVEGPLCYYHAALLYVAARLWPSLEANSRASLWLVGGVLAGGAMACKYPALVSAVVPFGLLALVDAVRRRSPRLVLAYALGWAAVMVPWLGKNVVDTGNPVYPLGYRVFGGRLWDLEREAKWNRVHGPKAIASAALVESFVDVAGRSDWQSPLYAALAPLALLRRESRRWAAALWGYAAYLFLTWWLLTHRLDRFWLPLLPVLAVLAGMGADWLRHWSWSVVLATVMGLSVTANFAYVSTALAGLNEWTGDLNELRTKVPEMLNRPLSRLDAQLPADAKVLLVGQAAVFHFQHRVVYNTVFNDETIELLTRGHTAAEVHRELRERGVTHVYVDWFEIERYRSPGNYGFTDFVQSAVFERLVAEGVLERPTAVGPRQQLFRVR